MCFISNTSFYISLLVKNFNIHGLGVNYLRKIFRVQKSFTYTYVEYVSLRHHFKIFSGYFWPHDWPYLIHGRSQYVQRLALGRPHSFTVDGILVTVAFLCRDRLWSQSTMPSLRSTVHPLFYCFQTFFGVFFSLSFIVLLSSPIFSSQCRSFSLCFVLLLCQCNVKTPSVLTFSMDPLSDPDLMYSSAEVEPKYDKVCRIVPIVHSWYVKRAPHILPFFTLPSTLTWSLFCSLLRMFSSFLSASSSKPFLPNSYRWWGKIFCVRCPF